MATNRMQWNAQVLVEDRKAVLAIISASQPITVEELLHQLPWMQWGHVFSLLGDCLQEGLVTWSQKECQFEIRAIQPLRNDARNLSMTEPLPLNKRDYKNGI